MITYRIWRQLRHLPLGDTYDHTRDGWFLLGLVPVYVRDRTERPLGDQ